MRFVRVRECSGDDISPYDLARIKRNDDGHPRTADCSIDEIENDHFCEKHRLNSGDNRHYDTTEVAIMPKMFIARKEAWDLSTKARDAKSTLIKAAACVFRGRYDRYMHRTSPRLSYLHRNRGAS